MNTSHGTGDIHGMVIANTDEDMRGTPNILYNDNCIANLYERFPSMARRVRNTWREVQPRRDRGRSHREVRRGGRPEGPPAPSACGVDTRRARAPRRRSRSSYT